MESLDLLRLLQLADSALPVGGMAHSFGVETLAAEGALTVEGVERFFEDYLMEAGALEGSFCRAAHALGAGAFLEDRWLDLNRRLSALKPARESRLASATLGRRFLELVYGLERRPLFEEALQAAGRGGVDVHHSAAFGLAGGALGFDEEATVVAYLHQSLAGLISACQRLMPLGQSQAGRILWNLKPAVAQAAGRGRGGGDEVACFVPMLELGSLRHPGLATRLFIS